MTSRVITRRQRGAGRFRWVTLAVPREPATRPHRQSRRCSTARARPLTRKAIELALAGDATALRLCLDRILPALRERPVAVELPTSDEPQDAVIASAALLAAVSAGEIVPGEAREIACLLEVHLKAIEVHDVEARLVALEARPK